MSEPMETTESHPVIEPHPVTESAPAIESFPALPYYYRLLFLYVEPFSTLFPPLLIWFFPGATWFYNELIFGMKPVILLDSRSTMAVWQLASCYGLLGMLSSFVFRAVRDALPDDPVAQERIIGASFVAMSIADVTHILVTIFATPEEVLMDPFSWNLTFIGNVPFVVILFLGRLMWFVGVGRQTYYYSLKPEIKTE